MMIIRKTVELKLNFMIEMTYKTLLIFLLLSGMMSNLMASDENTLVGIVIHQDTGERLDSVKIYVDNDLEFYSDSLGRIMSNSFRQNIRPKKVQAFKRGLEMASWKFINKELLIEMRNATMIHLLGQVVSVDREPLTAVEVRYRGVKLLKTMSDSVGRFVFEIPIGSGELLSDHFTVDNGRVQLNILNDNKVNASVDLILIPQRTLSIQLVLLDSNGKLVKGIPVFIYGKYYNSGVSGSFIMPEKSNVEDIIINNYEIIKIDTLSQQSKIILEIRKNIGKEYVKIADTVSSKSKKLELDAIAEVIELNRGQSTRQDSALTVQRERAISERLERVKYFFNDHENRIENQNILLTNLNDSLVNFTQFIHLDHEYLLTQLEEINQSIQLSSATFDETKKTAEELIFNLRTILDHKDLTIKNIKEEKDTLNRIYEDNIKTLSLLVLAFAIMLITAHWVIRRFKKQNREIEKTKRQLLEAHEMAKIANMVYDFENQEFVYSDNFFRTLNILSATRKKKLTSKSDGNISSELIDQNDFHEVLDNWKKMITTRDPIHIEFKGKSEGDQVLYLEMNAKLICDSEGKKINISTTLQNVTEKKENEIKLISALNQVEKASEAKEHFMASMSHEIRTPLNAIIGLTDHLLSQEHLASQLKNIDAIHFSSVHLLSLVNDMLDFSRIKAGKLKIENEAFALSEILSGLLKSMSLQAQEKNLELKLKFDKNIPVNIKGDSLRLSQVLMNLIGNGIKFTESGSISLIIKLVQIDSCKAELEFIVKDTGIGISEDRLDKIFEGFEQEKISTARNYGGSGLGLTISKELVSLMGGQLEVESKTKRGSMFFFTLPLQISNEASDEKHRDKTSLSERVKDLRLLCVDDNKINQLVISQYFKKWKIKFKFADNGLEALKIFKPSQFDFVLMDIRMPGMDGYEVTKKIFEKFPECQIPILALTAEVDEKTERKTREAGMSGYLLKPFKEEELLFVINKFGKKRRTK